MSARRDDPSEPDWTAEMQVDELHAALNQAYRFSVPRSLAEAVVAARGLDMWRAFGFDWEFQHGRRFRIFDHSYVGAVPDLFTFGRPGVDGLANGFIVHAPELELDELAVFQLDPVYGTVDAVAADFRTALVNFAAWDGGEYDESTVESAYPAVARALRLPAVPKPSRARNDAFDFAPGVPPGWSFVPTEDHIGVLAPAGSFGGDPIGVDEFRARYPDRAGDWDSMRRRGIDPLEGAAAMLQSLTEACADVLRAGYPGSALVGIRRTYRAMNDIGGYLGPKAAIFRVWADVNDALGRPAIAGALRDALAELSAHS